MKPRSCPPASSGSRSGTTTGIDNHVGDVGLNNVAVPVIVEQRERATLRGHAAGVHGCVRVVGFDEVEDSCVEGGGKARDASHVQGAEPSAVVHVIALWLDDPVLPANLLEVHEEFLAAAHPRVPTAINATPLDPVGCPGPGLGCNKWPVGITVASQEGRPPVLCHLQLHSEPLAPLAEEALDSLAHVQRGPAGPLHLQPCLTGHGHVQPRQVWLQESDGDRMCSGAGDCPEQVEGGLQDLGAPSQLPCEVEMQVNAAGGGGPCAQNRKQSQGVKGGGGSSRSWGPLSWNK